MILNTDLHIDINICNGACATVEVHCEVLQAYLFGQKLAHVVLKEVATCSLLQELRNREKPRHLKDVLPLHTVCTMSAVVHTSRTRVGEQGLISSAVGHTNVCTD